MRSLPALASLSWGRMGTGAEGGFFFNARDALFSNEGLTQ
jgi:hypothetical protein